MAIPTVAEVYSMAQALLGEPAGGEIYTSSRLQPFFATAFRDVVNLQIKHDIPMVNRDAYYVLPANSGIFTPAQAGITDFGEPKEMWERTNLVTATVATASNTTPIVVTTTGAHGFGDAGEVVQLTLNSVSGCPVANQMWWATIVDSTSFSLNNSVAGGAGVGGTAAISSDDFALMTPVEVLPQTTTFNQYLVWWKWQQDTFYFVGATQPVQVKVLYTSTGAPPASGSVGIDNSLDYLAYRTAALACAARDEIDRSQRLMLAALGPRLEVDASGGLLRDLCNPMLKQKQNIGKRRLAFRPRRNMITSSQWWW